MQDHSGHSKHGSYQALANVYMDMTPMMVAPMATVTPRVSKAAPRWKLAVTLLMVSVAAAAQADVGGPDTRRNYELPGTAAAYLSDPVLEQAVRQELEQDALLSAQRIEIDAADGVVKLDGDQPVLLALERATYAAERVPGVRQVINSIELWPRREVDGARLESDITYALLTDPATERGKLEVEAGDWGDVTLRGTVDSGAERRLAERIVKSIRGVQSVDNQIQIDRSDSRPDSEIVADVRRMLQWDADVNSGAIDVSAEDGVVTLAGTVSDGAEKRRAVGLSWVAGVKHVNVVPLNVLPDADSQKQQFGVPLELQSDEAIADAVQRAIKAHPRLLPAQIDISVKNGVATMQGTVDTLQAKRIAHSLPLGVLGVRSVRDRLRVGGLTAQSYDDAEIRIRVERALALNSLTAEDAIEAHVRKGTVTLTGEVGQQYSRRIAEELAEAVPGVRKIRNELVVAPEETSALHGGGVGHNTES